MKVNLAEDMICEGVEKESGEEIRQTEANHEEVFLTN